jgi:hypothetical protein
VDSYRSIDIYNIPLQDRTFRIAILGVDTVAASNHDDPQVIRGIIDRSRKLASPFGGPALLRQFYKRVPLASLAWAIFRIPSTSAIAAGQSNPGNSGLVSNQGATVVASVRYLGAVHFRAEAFTNDEQAAEQLTSQLNSFLAIFQSAEVAVSGQTPDPDVKKALASLKVQQNNNRTVLTATVPVELIRKMVSEVPREIGPQVPGHESK